MQGGDFGTNLMNLLEQQTMLLNPRHKQSADSSTEPSAASNAPKSAKSISQSRLITLSVDVKGVPFIQKYPETITVRTLQ
jgi:hypothetical protein